MKLYLGSDHGGFELKAQVREFLQQKFPDVEIEDVGCDSSDSCDYPQFGKKVAEKVVSTPGSRGIIACGSGIGISIAANRVSGARAVLANSLELTQLGRQHNDANILAIGGRTKFYDPWEEIVTTFLTEETDMAERHARRREQLDA
ncbi:MAG: RpiB/LacA/LacB family sugar-phosphate isomerase [Candidatus Gracilibacteria bacterium]|nr:RpiB/LacA/LacB family sugar-phosphate isomerase [Candidatus Gracilibacteria bacterium]